MSNYITVFTDGSYCPHTKSGGWAYWIKYGRGDVIRGAGFLNGASNPTVLEMEAINQALYRIVNNAPESLIRNSPKSVVGSMVIVQTDCIPAIHAIEKHRAHKAFVRTHRFLGGLQFRHVKGHRGTEDRRAAVNTWCDKAAGEQMREQRRVAKPNGRHDDLPRDRPDFVKNALARCPFHYPEHIEKLVAPYQTTPAVQGRRPPVRRSVEDDFGGLGVADVFFDEAHLIDEQREEGIDPEPEPEEPKPDQFIEDAFK